MSASESDTGKDPQIVPGSGSVENVPAAVLRRLRALLKMANDPAAPHQAANAAAVAAGIMRKYDLTLAAVSVAAGVGAAQPQSNGVIARIIYLCGKRVPTWVKPIVSAVTCAQHCHTTINQVDDENGNFLHTEFVCYGTLEDTDIVCKIVGMIIEQVNALAALYTGNRNSYRLGAAKAIQERVDAAVEHAEEEVARELLASLPAGRGAEVMSGALAVLDTKRARAIQAAEDAGIHPDSPKSTRAAVSDRDGYHDGYIAGQRVKVQLAEELTGTAATTES